MSTATNHEGCRGEDGQSDGDDEGPLEDIVVDVPKDEDRNAENDEDTPWEDQVDPHAHRTESENRNTEKQARKQTIQTVSLG